MRIDSAERKLVFGTATNEQFEIRLPVPAVVEPDPSRFAKVNGTRFWK